MNAIYNQHGQENYSMKRLRKITSPDVQLVSKFVCEPLIKQNEKSLYKVNDILLHKIIGTCSAVSMNQASCG